MLDALLLMSSSASSIPKDFFGTFSRRIIMPASNSISALSLGCSQH